VPKYIVDPTLAEAAKEKAREDLEVHADLLTWTAVHGSLQLALRHPQHTGPSRRIVEAFIQQLGQELIRRQFLTQQIIEEGERREEIFARPPPRRLK
jgi:hypothetical protein